MFAFQKEAVSLQPSAVNRGGHGDRLIL